MDGTGLANAVKSNEDEIAYVRMQMIARHFQHL